jgi:RNA recognition motif-containing protein
MKLIIRNVGKKVTADSLAAVFSTYGNVSSSTIQPDAELTSSSKTAFIHMPDKVEATKAIEQLNGCHIDGQLLLVEMEHTRTTSRVFSRFRRIRSFLSPKEKPLPFLLKDQL